MKNQSTEIPCPICQTKIPIDTTALLTGAKFNCPNPSCDASIALNTESNEAVKDAMEKFNEIKKDALDGEG